MKESKNQKSEYNLNIDFTSLTKKLHKTHENFIEQLRSLYSITHKVNFEDFTNHYKEIIKK